MARYKQPQLLDAADDAGSDGPVECLGMTFENDQARRDHFLEKLREKLQDPEFRKIEGFPIGEDEDILAMSDPPYYTACPNPFLEDFLTGRHISDSDYHREPYTSDVSESRNNSFVNTHSYATKVPHQAVMKYILHYTKPGDVVYDGFCGTGMTGVAAQLCAAPSQEFRQHVEQELSSKGLPAPEWGSRFAVQGDLSPAATFIARNLIAADDVVGFSEKADVLLKTVEEETSWMYKTSHSDGREGRIHCTFWSDVFICSECAKEVVFWDAAVDLEANELLDEFQCPSCTTHLVKRGLERAFVSRMDPAIHDVVRLPKQVPVVIFYHVGKLKHEKRPDAEDLRLIERIDSEAIPFSFPILQMMFKDGKWGDTWRSGTHAGITHLHHLFTTRNLRSLAFAWQYAKSPRLKFMMTSLMYKSSILCSPLLSNFFAERRGENRGGWVGKERSGTLFRGSIMSEVPISPQIRSRKSSVALTSNQRAPWCLQVVSATNSGLPDNSVDYVFTDPPFGANRIYSELNFMWEAWHRVFTLQESEAIISSTQGKRLNEYQEMMVAAFKEYFRVLRPCRWITVEFSNTRASVWNAIQTSISEAGFVVADVRALDKKQGSINALTTSTAVKQDLVISGYKPSQKLEQEFQLVAGTEQGAWNFIESHLVQLPVFVSKNGNSEVIPERQRFLLFDRMVAFHVQRGVSIPLSAPEFHEQLNQKFPQRDEMYFLEVQVAEYERKRMKSKQIRQLELFVSDESSAIQWLRQCLLEKPQTRQELHAQFLMQISGWQAHEQQIELIDLLDENFLCYDGDGEVPSQIHSYLSSNYHELRKVEKLDSKLRVKAAERWYVPDHRKEVDLEKIRHRSLMREFKKYGEGKGKLTKVRTEALRAGFAELYRKKQYRDIVALSRRIKDSIIQEDMSLLMYHDNAVMLAEA